jgi:hypothetical protein
MSDIEYEIHVVGTPQAPQFEELPGVVLTRLPAMTVLTGTVPDQAALLGILARLRSLGLEVREVRRRVDES